ACFEFDVDYFGYDIEKIEDGSVASAEECQTICQSKAECFYFSYVSDKKNCYLKNSSALAGRIADSTTVGIVSGAKYC
ncbi:pan domain-containing protein, partial [Cystoisospora suis]